VLSAPLVAVLLLTSWDGRTTIFGNAKWGKGEANGAYLKSGYFAAWNWLVIRNPVNNLMSGFLSVKQAGYIIDGNRSIGEKVRGGSYWCFMGNVWEYYSITPYNFFGRRCIRIRIGWKINGNDVAELAPYVFAFNPIKQYSGI
jgi:hypothetical protein